MVTLLVPESHFIFSIAICHDAVIHAVSLGHSMKYELVVTQRDV
jgi:hypothetical protein